MIANLQSLHHTIDKKRQPIFTNCVYFKLDIYYSFLIKGEENFIIYLTNPLQAPQANLEL